VKGGIFLDIDTLESFLHMAEVGSLSQAAEELYLSVSSLSSRIKRLEGEIGQELFILRGRNLQLSEAGKVFVPYAQRVCHLVKELQQELIKRENEMNGCLRLASTSVIATYVLPDLLSQFKEQYPNMEIEIFVCPNFMIFDYLLRGNVDLGIIQGIERHEDLEYTPWFSDEDILVVSEKHPWAQNRKVSVQALPEYPLIAFDRQSILWRQRMKWIESQSVGPWIGMEIAHMETAKEILLNNYGYAFLPRQGVRKELRKERLQEIELNESPKWVRETSFAMHSKQNFSESAQEFVEFCLKLNDVYKLNEEGEIVR
jgi:DNA-binding transcriptional LysR family regulator